jgi:lysophospholipase L1-like esterase
MGITPRNDDMEMMPVITAVNRRIARLADGHRIRYLNINDRLADNNGRLYEGMTQAGKLHLAAQGYQVWADALKPMLTAVLGPPAPVDSAPAPSSTPLITQVTQ